MTMVKLQQMDDNSRTSAAKKSPAANGWRL